MLKQLADYAWDKKIVTKSGFTSKDINWAIVLDSAKGFSGLVPLGQADRAKKRSYITLPGCPEMDKPLMQGKVKRCHFLVETADVVALYGERAEDAKTQAKHGYFIHLLEESGKTMPQLAVIAQWLKDERTIQDIKKAMDESKVSANDKVTFQIDGEFPVEQDYWHDWWRSFLRNLNDERRKKDAAEMRCFISGEIAPPVATHRDIKGLADVDANPSGAVLIGFDKDAFCSYGLKQSANAAVSEEAMNSYRAGLNDLIKNHSQRLVSTRVIHWFKKKVKPEDDPLEWLIEPQEIEELNARHKAMELLESIKTGKRPDLGGNYYYVLTLSGAGGRVMVRDWIEGQFEELVKNITQWFDDLEIVQRDGSLPKQSPRFLAALGSLAARKLDELPAPVIAKMWRLAVRGESIPYSFLAQSLARRKMEMLQPDEKPINSTGMGLIRAYHLRKYRKTCYEKSRG